MNNVFKPDESAGTLDIVIKKTGKVKSLPIRISDIPLAASLEKLSQKYSAKERQVNDLRKKKRSELTLEEMHIVGEYGTMQFDYSLKMLQLYTDITSEDLQGYSIMKVQKMISHCMVASINEPKDESEKKPEPVGRSASSKKRSLA